MSEEIQNEEIVVEDVQEEDLVENQELVQDTPEEVAEASQESHSDSVLDILLGEAKKNNEAEDEEDDEDESDDEESDDDEDEDEDDEVEESVEVDEETIEESSEEEVEENLEEGVQTKAGILADAFSTIKSMKKHDLSKAFEAMNGDDEDEEDEMEEGEVKSAPPKTKAEMVNAMYKEMKGMKKDDLMAAFDAIKSTADGEEEDEEEMEEAFATDLKVLADADSNLTEDFKAKASILFEAAVANKVATIKEELENTYEDSLQEEVVYIRETLIEKIDNYITYVVEDWMSENQEYVDNKLRTDIAEDFMKNLKDLFVESYIEVPESKVDLVDSLSEDVEATKSELITISEERDYLASQIVELQREKIISEATLDLTSTQTSKFVKLLEGIEFVDASNFETKVSVIKESFFNEEEPTQATQELEEETSSDKTEIIVEGEANPAAELSPTMQKYLSSLSRIQQNIHNK